MDAVTGNDVYVDILETNNITVEVVEQTISVEAGEVGPPGGGIGTMLMDYSIKGQLMTWDTGSADINVDFGNTVQAVMHTNTTLQPVTGWPGPGEEGKVTIYVQQAGGGPYRIDWPAGIHWVNGNTPDLSTFSDKWDVIILTTIDAGATVFGFHVGTTS